MDFLLYQWYATTGLDICFHGSGLEAQPHDTSTQWEIYEPQTSYKSNHQTCARLENDKSLTNIFKNMTKYQLDLNLVIFSPKTTGVCFTPKTSNEKVTASQQPQQAPQHRTAQPLPRRRGGHPGVVELPGAVQLRPLVLAVMETQLPGKSKKKPWNSKNRWFKNSK